MYSTIINVIDKSLNKCHDYPKARALDYFKANQDNFAEEDYGYGVNRNQIPSPQGELQKVQEDLQENIDYSSLESGALHDYQTNSFIPLGYWLNGGELPTTKDEMRRTFGFFPAYIRGEDGEFLYGDRSDEKGEFVMAVHNYPNGFEDETGHSYVDLTMPEESDLISRAISKTPPLEQDTVLYTYRELPPDLKVGDHSAIKGFGSCSYNPYVIDDIEQGGPWVQGEKNRRYKVKVYAMKGTKGIVLNDHSSGIPPWQSEWLLDKGQKYVVWSKNDNDMTAEIILY